MKIYKSNKTRISLKEWDDNPKIIKKKERYTTKSNSLAKLIYCFIVYLTGIIIYTSTFCDNVIAQTAHINARERNTTYYDYGGYQTGTSGWQQHGYNWGSVITLLNTASNSQVELCADTSPSEPGYGGSYSPGNYNNGYSEWYNYRTNWITSAGGGIVDRDSDVTLMNTLNSPTSFSLTNFEKRGTGTLTLDRTGNSFTLTVTNFSGTGGTLKVGNTNTVTLNTTNTSVGSSTGFTADVTSGSTWNASTLTASQYFNKTGAGTLNATSSTITGTSTINEGNWNTSGGMTVGNGIAGNLIITGNGAGTERGHVTTGGASNIGNANGTGQVTVNMGGADWTTNGVVNVANSANGGVTLTGGGDWTSNVVVNVGVSNDSAHTGTVTINDAGSLWDANDSVYIATTANSKGIVNLSAGEWNVAATKDVEVGVSGDGTVNQSGGQWTNEDTIIAKNAGSKGKVYQSGGVHDEETTIVGDAGTGVLDIYGSGTVTNTRRTTGDDNDDIAIIANEDTARGTASVYGGGTWNIGATSTYKKGDLITAEEGKGQLRVFTQNSLAGVVNVYGNHVIAQLADSYGSDIVDGDGSQLNVTDGMIVGDLGQAGGRYKYYRQGDKDNTNGSYFNGGNPSTGGGDYKDPESWLDSPNITLVPDDTDWGIYEDDAPGLAITAGGLVKVDGTEGVKVANQDGSYAYILLDNKGTGHSGIATWQIANDLIMAVDGRTNDNNDDAYMRIINGAKATVGKDAVFASGAGTEVTVRVNGTDGTNFATLDVAKNLTVAKGVAAGANTEGNLYVYNKGQVKVGTNTSGNMTIADEVNAIGRVHVDEAGSLVDVNGKLTVANKGTAGHKYTPDARNIDYDPTNDAYADPSTSGELGKWFDDESTLSDLKVDNDVNKNAPGLLITRGAKVKSNSGSVATVNGSYAYVVIDGADQGTGRSEWEVDTGSLIIADAGEALVRVFNGGLIQTTNTTDGDIVIANSGTGVGTVRVFGAGSEIKSAHDLIVAEATGSDGQLYIYNKASGNVGNNMIIADAKNSNAQVQVDGAGTKLTVDHRLTVGQSGNAGAYYNENRYDLPVTDIPSTPDSGYRKDPIAGTDDQDRTWFGSKYLDLRNNKNYAGNAPGLAITDGAYVTSGSAVVAAESTDGDAGDSVGYVLIDNAYGFNGASDRTDTDRSTWLVTKTTGGADDQNGDLIIGREGKGFVRVLNGALLKVEGNTKLNSKTAEDTAAEYHFAGEGSLYVIGNGGAKRAWANDAASEQNDMPFTPYKDGNRSAWINDGATFLGDTGDTIEGGEATLRINDGAFGSTHGLFAGYSKGSHGDVSVMGMASELHVFKYAGDNDIFEEIKGTASLAVSNHGFLQIHEEGNVTLNGKSTFTHNALLHLDKNSLLDSRAECIHVTNARVEGIGTMTAEKGVVFSYDDQAESLLDPVYKFGDDRLSSMVTQSTSTQIDPGLYYGWDDKDEYYQRYGTLTFGDSLKMVGNVTTFFDVNAGWIVPDADPTAPSSGDSYTDNVQMNDTLLVKRGTYSGSKADIYAQLSGTLKIHARLTGYFVDNPSFMVVKTEGDGKSGTFAPGRVTRMFDRLEIVPWRFFEDPRQEIRTDENTGDEQLWVSMVRKKNPFEEAGHTYNEKSTGAALDSIYAKNDNDWLPLLRGFWYLEDPAFLDNYRTLSGEIRAHSLLLPLQNPWSYNQNRIGFRENPNAKPKREYLDPCEMAKLAADVNCASLVSRLKKCWDRCKKDVRVWGDFIYDNSDLNSDGNAANVDLNRHGAVIGIDKPTKDGKSYFGFQFAISHAELKSYLSEAQMDDFNFGLYHGRKIHNVFEWRNYLGMGIGRYDTKRDLNSALAFYNWEGSTTDPTNGHYASSGNDFDGTPRSHFTGYNFYANTEIARPFILGTCNQYMIRPYIAVDMVSIWQNAASEYGDFKGAELVKLDFHSSSSIRTYGRPGILFERNGDRINLHAGLSYAFLLGGRHYTNVNNQFQFGGNKFNIRSVDTGNDFLNLNCGTELYLGKKRNQFAMLNYQALFGKNITTQSIQLGYQYKF